MHIYMHMCKYMLFLGIHMLSCFSQACISKHLCDSCTWRSRQKFSTTLPPILYIGVAATEARADFTTAPMKCSKEKHDVSLGFKC